MATAQGMNAIAKKYYDEGTKSYMFQQNLEAPMFKKIKKDPAKPTIKGIDGYVIFAGQEQGGAMFEGASFNQQDEIVSDNPTIKARELNYPFTYTGRFIELTKDNKQAIANGVNTVMTDVQKRAFSDQERQLFGTGTGQMSLVNGAVVASVTVPVDNIVAFRRNMKIDIWTAVGGTKQASAVQIVGISYSTSALTLATAVTVSDNAIIVKQGILDGVTTEYKELNGFQNYVDTNEFGVTFEGISSTTNPEWQGNVIDASGGPISQSLLQKAHYMARIVGGSYPKYLCSNYDQPQPFLNTEQQKTRYEGSKIESGNTVLKWSDLEWHMSKYHALNQVTILDLEFIKRFETGELHIADYTGNKFYQLAGANAIGGYYTYVGQVGGFKRNAHTKIKNLNPVSLFAV